MALNHATEQDGRAAKEKVGVQGPPVLECMCKACVHTDHPPVCSPTKLAFCNFAPPPNLHFATLLPHQTCILQLCSPTKIAFCSFAPPPKLHFAALLPHQSGRVFDLEIFRPKNFYVFFYDKYYQGGVAWPRDG
jgi:hypothetical protein